MSLGLDEPSREGRGVALGVRARVDAVDAERVEPPRRGGSSYSAARASDGEDAAADEDDSEPRSPRGVGALARLAP